MTGLRHFVIVTWAVPIERLRPHVHPRFAIHPFPIGGRPMGLFSAVCFLDVGFRFPWFLPFPRFTFGQTNNRLYVIDQETGEPGVWFLGTTLGSLTVHIPRAVWRMPWHPARYTFGCDYDAEARRYRRFDCQIESDWGAGTLSLEDSGAPPPLLPGFEDLEHQTVHLTHPVQGWYWRSDDRVGAYSIWHERLPLTAARTTRCRFALYERLEIATREEIAAPHSALICPETRFEIHMPPRAVPGLRRGD